MPSPSTGPVLGNHSPGIHWICSEDQHFGKKPVCLGLHWLPPPGTNLCGPGHRHWLFPTPNPDPPSHPHSLWNLCHPLSWGFLMLQKHQCFFDLGGCLFSSLIKTNPGPGKGKGCGKVLHFAQKYRVGLVWGHCCGQPSARKYQK